MNNTKEALILVLVSVIIGVAIGIFAMMPLGGYLAYKNSEIEKLEKELHDFRMCTMDNIVCDFEKETPTPRD